MALDDHDQLQNDKREIDAGGTWSCMETWGNGREDGRGSVFVLRETALLRVVLNEHYLHNNVFIATVNAP